MTERVRMPWWPRETAETDRLLAEARDLVAVASLPAEDRVRAYVRRCAP
jgi:hypothetical protein